MVCVRVTLAGISQRPSPPMACVGLLQNIIIPVIILLGYVVIFVAVIAGNKWRLTKQLGYVFIVAHAFFVVWSLLTMLDNPVISI